MNKIIAVDLDGTLLNANSEVSQRTLTALQKANAAGYHTVAVTGRSWRTATDPLKPADGIEYIVCSNGAYLYHQNEAVIHWEEAMATDTVNTLVSAVRMTLPQVSLGWESRNGFSFEQEFLNLATDNRPPENGGEGDGLGTAPLYKLFIRTPDTPTSDMLAMLAPEIGHLAEISTSGAPFVEATSAGANKATGLARIANELGISAKDTIAFGDNHNDLPMLAWAGTSVAMGNAVPQVKSMTDHTTIPNTEHGVAVYLENLLGL